MASREFGQLTVELRNQKATLTVEGWLHYNTSRDLKAAIDTVLDSGVQTLSIDLEHCAGLASTAIGTLVRLAATMKERGGSMSITRRSPELDRLLRAMQLEQLLSVSSEP